MMITLWKTFWTVFLILAGCILLAGIGKAHEWYSWECCSDNDCALVTDPSHIKWVDGEWQVYSGAWVVNHKGVKLVVDTPKIFKEHELKFSPDGRMHLCISANKAICLYLGFRG